MNCILPDSNSVAAPQPPFTPVQVVESLPAIPQPAAQTEPPTSLSRSKAKRENPTGLTRAEIQLLSQAVDSARSWRGSIVGHPDPQVVQDFDDRIAAMRAAIRKLKAASGITFSGKKGRKA